MTYVPKNAYCTDCEYLPSEPKMPFAYDMVIQHGLENDHAVMVEWEER